MCVTECNGAACAARRKRLAMRLADGLATVVSNASEVWIYPALSGGS